MGNIIMTKYVGNIFFGKTLCGSFWELVVSFVLVSWWSVHFVSVVVGVLVALWWRVRSVQRVAKVVPRLVRIVENSFGALDFEKSCLFVKRIGNA